MTKKSRNRGKGSRYKKKNEIDKRGNRVWR